jgi:hypothetical protein
MLYLSGVASARSISIRIFTLSGSSLFTKRFSNFNSNRIDLNVSSLKPGAYLIQIITENKKELHKFLKL